MNKIHILKIMCAFFLVFGSTISNPVSAQNTKDHSLTFRGGYFIPARAKFRDIYKDSFGFAIQYEKQLNKRLNLSLESGYLLQGESEASSKYSNLYLVPTVLYKLDSGGTFSWYCGAGIGLNFRKISSTYFENIGQNDFGPSINLVFGNKINLSQSLFLYPRIMFDYIYDAHPELGDFGNTGGVYFSLGFGFRL